MLDFYRLAENPIRTDGRGLLFWILICFTWALLLLAVGLIVMLLVQEPSDFLPFDTYFIIGGLAVVAIFSHRACKTLSQFTVTLDGEGIKFDKGDESRFLSWSEFGGFHEHAGKLNIYDRENKLRLSLPVALRRMREILTVLADMEIRANPDRLRQALSQLPVPYQSLNYSGFVMTIVVVAGFFVYFAWRDGIQVFYIVALGVAFIALSFGRYWRITVGRENLEARGFPFFLKIPLREIADVEFTCASYRYDIYNGRFDHCIRLIMHDGSMRTLNIDEHEWMPLYLALCRATGKIDRLVLKQQA